MWWFVNIDVNVDHLHWHNWLPCLSPLCFLPTPLMHVFSPNYLVLCSKICLLSSSSSPSPSTSPFTPRFHRKWHCNDYMGVWCSSSSIYPLPRPRWALPMGAPWVWWGGSNHPECGRGRWGLHQGRCSQHCQGLWLPGWACFRHNQGMFKRWMDR